MFCLHASLAMHAKYGITPVRVCKPTVHSATKEPHMQGNNIHALRHRVMKTWNRKRSRKL